jgi:hypothetical protein
MFSLIKLFWSVSLMIFLTGCSGFGVVGFSRPDPSFGNDQEIGTIWDLKTGDRAILELVDGTRVEGIVKFNSPFEIVLDAEANSLQPRGYTTGQILSIQKQSALPSGTKTSILKVAGILLIGGLAVSKGMESVFDLGGGGF